MKKYQIFILVVICFLLTGCGWDDVQNDYGDLLKKKPSCVYNADSSVGNMPGIKTLTFSADYDGFYVGYDEAARQKAFGTSDANSQVNINGVYVQVEDGFAKSFLKEYINSGNRCPQNVYLSRSYPESFRMEYDDEHGYLDIFSLNHTIITKPSDNTSITSKCGDKYCYCNMNPYGCALQDGPTEFYKSLAPASFCNCNEKNETPTVNRMCHHSYATDCIKFKKGDYNYEFGYYSKADSSIGKYFIVSYNNNYNPRALVELKDDEEVMEYFNLAWFVITGEAINEIWYDNGKILPKEQITIKEDPMQTSPMFYITGPNSTNYGWDNRDQGIGEDAPDIDPDFKEQYVVEESLEVNPINICAKDAGTLKAFQIIGYIIFIMKIVVPLLLIIMASLDFAKAVVSSGEKPNIDVLKKVGTRIGIAVIIFIIPTVLDFLLSLVGGTKETMEGFEPCTACLLDPLGKCQDQFND